MSEKSDFILYHQKVSNGLDKSETGVYKGIKWEIFNITAYIFLDILLDEDFKKKHDIVSFTSNEFVIMDNFYRKDAVKEHMFVVLEAVYQHLISMYELDGDKYKECEESFKKL